jgi:hypothetical protein
MRRLIASPAETFAVEKYCAQHANDQGIVSCASSLRMSPFKVWQSFRKIYSLNSREVPIGNASSAVRPRGKVYFKSTFYAPFEIPFIKMNLLESFPYIDRFIIVECNRTHVGAPRKFIFESNILQIPPVLREKILYIKADVSEEVVDCTTSRDGYQMHQNENILWDSFEKYIDLRDDDVVIAADADEVIYRKVYPLIFALLRPDAPLLLPLHQFFYRMNYLWKDEIFWAPVAAYARYYKHRPHPHKWRYEGKRFHLMAGCHFSWQLTIEQMLFKLGTYAHNDIYGHLADREVLQDAVNKKTYPFEPDRTFVIEELNPDQDRIYYPESFFEFRQDFEHLLPVGGREA